MKRKRPAYPAFLDDLRAVDDYPEDRLLFFRVGAVVDDRMVGLNRLPSRAAVLEFQKRRPRRR